MNIGYIGLGKMGLRMALKMKEGGINVLGFNRDVEGRHKANEEGIETRDSIKELCESFSGPKTIWIMVSHGAVDEVLKEVYKYIGKGDTVIEGGNSFYKESVRRGKEAEGKGINFLDIGVSGGPSGARNGACLMIGGKKEVYEKYVSLFEKISAPNAFAYLGESGAGHFAKMVHNGIEYGMMQAMGEGFEVLKKSEFNFDLWQVTRIYNNKSVIESRLTQWLLDGFAKYGNDLDAVSGEVKHSGEGQWTVETAKELGVPVQIIEDSLEFRKKSTGNPSFTGKVVSTLRNQFGEHEVAK